MVVVKDKEADEVMMKMKVGGAVTACNGWCSGGGGDNSVVERLVKAGGMFIWVKVA